MRGVHLRASPRQSEILTAAYARWLVDGRRMVDLAEAIGASTTDVYAWRTSGASSRVITVPGVVGLHAAGIITDGEGRELLGMVGDDVEWSILRRALAILDGAL